MRLLYYWSKLFKKLRWKSIVNTQIHQSSKVEAGCNIVNSIMDKHSFCGYDCEVSNCDIGSFCSIANGVIIGGGMHPMEWVSMSPVFYDGRDSVKEKFSTHKRNAVKRTLIGHDVWIGERALIKQGITIGIGAVVGMGSVVTKDIEPYTIVAGCPAKVIRKRFNNDTIKILLDTKWWDFSDVKLREYAQYFNDPVEFIKMIEK